MFKGRSPRERSGGYAEVAVLPCVKMLARNGSMSYETKTADPLLSLGPQNYHMLGQLSHGMSSPWMTYQSFVCNSVQ